MSIYVCTPDANENAKCINEFLCLQRFVRDATVQHEEGKHLQCGICSNTIQQRLFNIILNCILECQAMHGMVKTQTFVSTMCGSHETLDRSVDDDPLVGSIRERVHIENLHHGRASHVLSSSMVVEHLLDLNLRSTTQNNC